MIHLELRFWGYQVVEKFTDTFACFDTVQECDRLTDRPNCHSIHRSCISLGIVFIHSQVPVVFNPKFEYEGFR